MNANATKPTSHAETKPATADAPEVWVLSFRATGEGPDPAIRVRRLLKAALRAYGLRCVSIGERTPNQLPAETASNERQGY